MSGQHPKTGQFRYGVIAEIDAARSRVKVRLDEQNGLVTHWLPITAQKSLKDKCYWMPEPGEQVALLTDQHCEDGVVIGAIYSDPDPTPGEDLDHQHFGTWFEDGTVIRYRKDEHGLLVDLSACQGSITIKCQAVSIEAQQAEVQAETLTATTTTATISGQQVSVSAPDIGLTGLVTVDGDIEI